MTASISEDRGGHAATIGGRTTIRPRHAARAGRARASAWRPLHATEPAGNGRITVERHRRSQDRVAASPAAPATLSLLAHAACLLALVLFLPDHLTLPDIPSSTQVAMVFEAAPAAVPSVPAAPVATPDAVPTPPAPPVVAALTDAPPPPQVAQPPAAQVPVPPPPVPVPPRTERLPAPVPPPVQTAAVPLPALPVHLARIVPKTVAPPPRTPPATREVVRQPPRGPARTFASLTPPPAPAPAEAPAAEVAAARPVASGPLMPPRPVAGMETNRAPAYPELALRRGEAGRVMLRVSVSAHGRPLEVDVMQSSGFPSLDSAALTAVRQWQFVPATQAGIPVAAVAEVPIRFRIDN